ncbi:cell division protein DivIC [Bacillus sp. OV322]|nr:septum formation initiator family protein [Bacillus sp. OV322]SFD01512.1 cell division protein DivIC [Bacillus sp. OV322]
MGSLRKKKVAKLETPYVFQQEKNVQTVERKRKGLIRRLTFYAVCAAILSVLAITTLLTQAAALDKKEQEKAAVHKKLTALKSRESDLREEIVKLNDDDYIAKLARRDYFLSDKGEIIFNLPKKKNQDSD